MLRLFYMREFGDGQSDTLYGLRSEFKLPWQMFLRGSGLIRDYDDESEVDQAWGWNVLAIQTLTPRVQLLAQYEQFDDGWEHLDLTSRPGLRAESISLSGRESASVSTTGIT